MDTGPKAPGVFVCNINLYVAENKGCFEGPPITYIQEDKAGITPQYRGNTGHTRKYGHSGGKTVI